MTPIAIEGNLNETEAWSGSVMLGPGSHIVQCVSTEEGKSSNDNPYFMIELEAVAGEEVGATIRDWITVTPSTYGKVKQVLLAFGAKIPDSGFNLDPQTLVGKRTKIVVRREEKRNAPGEMTNNVKSYSVLSAEEQVKGAFPGAKEVGTADAKDDKDIPF